MNTLSGKHILILGAGVMQLPAIRIAREMGLRVTVADGNPAAEGIPLADHFIHEDLRDKEALLNAARSLKPAPDGVFTAGTDFSFNVAWIADKLGLPGISPATALKATDKSLMRQAFAEHGVPGPGFFGIDKGSFPGELETLLGDLSFPLVVKPVDNMGGRGIRKVDTSAECHMAVREAFNQSQKRCAIVEEFIEGDEYSIDALVWDDKVYICGIADRHIFFPPYFIEMGHTMPTASPPDIQESIISVFTKGIKALGIRRGAAKGDIKVNSRGAFVGEIAARLSGGYMSGWTYPYSSGIHPAVGGLRIALGQEPFSTFSPHRMVSAERAYISIPGKVKQISGIQEGIATLYIKNHFSRVSRGDRVIFPRNNVEKCGNFISLAMDREMAVKSAEDACRCVFIGLEPDDNETFLFLTGKTGCHWTFAHEKTAVDTLVSLPLFSCGEGSSSSVSDGFTVMPPPSLFDSTMVSWTGEPCMSQIDRCRRMGISFEPSGFIVGGPFWLAFLRGGAQGGVWFRDTLELHVARGDWKEWLKSWY